MSSLQNLSDIIGIFNQDGICTYFWKGIPEEYLHSIIVRSREAVEAAEANLQSANQRLRAIQQKQRRNLKQQLSQMQDQLDSANRKIERYRKRTIRSNEKVTNLSQESHWTNEALTEIDDELMEEADLWEENEAVWERFIELTSRKQSGTPGRLVFIAEKIFRVQKAALGSLAVPLDLFSQEIFRKGIKGLGRTSISQNIQNIDKMNYAVERSMCQGKPVGLMLDISKVCIALLS